MDKNYLLDPGLLGRLERYRLARHRPVPDGHAGPRRSPRKGGGVEFSDFREYTAGDELRRVDWKAYARLGRLYVKEYRDERQDSVLFIIDTSASMDWGGGDEHKGRCALRIAAGLGACALIGNDRLAVVAGSGPATSNDIAGAGEEGGTGDNLVRDFSGIPEESGNVHESAGSRGDLQLGKTTRMRVFPSRDGRRYLPLLWSWLAEAAFGGGTDLAGCLRAGLAAMPGAANLYVFSDLLDPRGVEEMLRQAAGRGLAVTLLQVLAPGELQPPGEGEWTMVDMETGEQVEVSLTPAALQDYGRRLAGFFDALDHSCRRWGARRVLIDSGQPLPEILLRNLPGQGVLTITGG